MFDSFVTAAADLWLNNSIRRDLDPNIDPCRLSMILHNPNQRLKSREVKNVTETNKAGRGIIHHVLQRMSVDGDDTDGSGPLVVLFVDMLVEAGVVEQPERKDDEQSPHRYMQPCQHVFRHSGALS